MDNILDESEVECIARRYALTQIAWLCWSHERLRDLIGERDETIAKLIDREQATTTNGVPTE